MNRKEFIAEMKAFAKDIMEICSNYDFCEDCIYCPLFDKDSKCCIALPRTRYFDPEKALEIVEAHRKRNKPFAELNNEGGETI